MLNAKKKKILIVEDAPTILDLLRLVLTPYYTVIVAESGEKALSILTSQSYPDLVLLDIIMPEMDGYEVLKQLKSNSETQNIPVIFITALNTTEDEIQGLKLGAADYISKPFEPSVLLARITSHLQLKEAQDRLRESNICLKKEIALRIGQFQKIQDMSVRALAILAEVRDNETGNHILRTQGYVNLLANELATHSKYAHILNNDVIDIYTKAAVLHDIGKVGIPDNVLHKLGKYNAEEWEIMKSHSQIGADAISRAIQNEEEGEKLDCLKIAIEIAQNHHEKWDGSGYPNGLKEDEIPLSARLMALADVFDALISKRIYKQAFPIEKATRIIVAGKGRHFEPELVDAFLARLDDFRTIAERYSEKDKVH